VNSVIVGISDCKVSGDPGDVLLTYALGSCVAVAIHDRVAGVGGLLHFLLPDSSLEASKAAQNPCMFADTGIPYLLEKAAESGASRERLSVRIAGGAQMINGHEMFQIGRRNSLAARKLLWREGLIISGEAIGGEVSRTLRLEIGSGKIAVWESGLELPAASVMLNTLIVDDSPTTRALIRRVMERAGVQAEHREASNGREALDKLTGRRPDLILTDINMPVMDGEQFLTELRRFGITNSTAVVVISTDATQARVERMLSLGARGYISKPFTPESLRSELERVLPKIAKGVFNAS
jgi:chemotaxis protein CheD